jgi:hypothetical protein
MDLHGIGPVNAARILADIGDVARFPSRAHHASWNGPAPLDASSGEQVRHRQSRAGNRRVHPRPCTWSPSSDCVTRPRQGVLAAQEQRTGHGLARHALSEAQELRHRPPRLVTDAKARQDAQHSRASIRRWRQVGLGTPGASLASSAADLP